MRTLRLFLFLAAVCAVPALASAQVDPCSTSPCTIGVQKSFTVAADHQPVDGDTNGYRLYINGTAVQTKTVAQRINIQPDGTGTIEFPVSGLAKGQYVLYVESFGDGGQTGSTTLTLNVVPGKPKAPTGLRIVSTQ